VHGETPRLRLGKAFNNDSKVAFVKVFLEDDLEVGNLFVLSVFELVVHELPSSAGRWDVHLFEVLVCIFWKWGILLHSVNECEYLVRTTMVWGGALRCCALPLGDQATVAQLVLAFERILHLDSITVAIGLSPIFFLLSHHHDHIAVFVLEYLGSAPLVGLILAELGIFEELRVLHVPVLPKIVVLIHIQLFIVPPEVMEIKRSLSILKVVVPTYLTSEMMANVSIGV
jgi:hypothetical protein